MSNSRASSRARAPSPPANAHPKTSTILPVPQGAVARMQSNKKWELHKCKDGKHKATGETSKSALPAGTYVEGLTSCFAVYLVKNDGTDSFTFHMSAYLGVYFDNFNNKRPFNADHKKEAEALAGSFAAMWKDARGRVQDYQMSVAWGPNTKQQEALVRQSIKGVILSVIGPMTYFAEDECAELKLNHGDRHATSRLMVGDEWPIWIEEVNLKRGLWCRVPGRPGTSGSNRR